MQFSHGQSSTKENSNKLTPLHDLILIPLGCVLKTPLLLVLVGLVAIGSWIAYTNFNWDIFGIAAPPYGEWQINREFTSVVGQDGKSWKIMYEIRPESTFIGIVRHVTPIRESRYPILSHDILIAQGDYANPDLVATSVSNHHFYWYAKNKIEPAGSINLLHTVPQNEAIYNSLLQIRKSDQVRIIGREIKSIVFYQKDGSKAATWMDTGCNTLLVTKVEILPNK
jgi:hypothetical protein